MMLLKYLIASTSANPRNPLSLSADCLNEDKTKWVERSTTWLPETICKKNSGSRLYGLSWLFFTDIVNLIISCAISARQIFLSTGHGSFLPCNSQSSIVPHSLCKSPSSCFSYIGSGSQSHKPAGAGRFLKWPFLPSIEYYELRFSLARLLDLNLMVLRASCRRDVCSILPTNCNSGRLHNHHY